MHPIAEHDLDTAAKLIAGARRIVALTGAGISTESGIPDFRSPGGLWTRYDPTKLTFDKFRASAETRRLYWEMGNELFPVLRDAQPNAAHRALAALERRGGLLRIVTQNVDGLHQKAGSSTAVVIEIHGTALEVGCLTCGARQPRGPVQARFAAGEYDLRCDCGGLLKPATISFGQAMPERETAQAFADADEADVFLVIGSSLEVYPAAGLPRTAVENGTSLVIVNREATPYDPYAHVLLHGSAGETLTAVARKIGLALTDA
ncbi:MAG: Sir2 family NAD-dependent protein deacetylase [Deltaproteobacteria bacterium]|nr:Sir2 family NAD-dependent protein deacetylase [Deltaproteobacteria bacterium]